jgi:hypothetical protein
MGKPLEFRFVILRVTVGGGMGLGNRLQDKLPFFARLGLRCPV